MVKQQQSPKKEDTESDYAWAVQQRQKVIAKWQSLPTILRYLVTALVVILAIFLIIPKNEIYSDENPIGIEAISQSVKGYSIYSAEPIKNGSAMTLVADERSTEETPLTDVGTTKSEVAIPTLDQQEVEYEAFFASLNESRRINGDQLSLSIPAEATSSTSSTGPEVSRAETSSTAAANSTVSNSNLSQEQAVMEPGVVTYTVKAGDNLYRIGVNNGLTLEEIMALNGMSVPEVTPGQVIRVR